MVRRRIVFPLGCGHFFSLERNYGNLASSWERNRICFSVQWYFGASFYETILPFYHPMMKAKTETKWKEICSVKTRGQRRTVEKCDSDQAPAVLFAKMEGEGKKSTAGIDLPWESQNIRLITTWLQASVRETPSAALWQVWLSGWRASHCPRLSDAGNCPSICFLLEEIKVDQAEVSMLSLCHAPWKLRERETRSVGIRTGNSESFGLSMPEHKIDSAQWQSGTGNPD